VPIINDIKSKDTVDQAYADKQSAAIQAILTDAQKNTLNTRPQRGNNQQPGAQEQNGQQQGNTQQGSTNAGNGNQQGSPNIQSGNIQRRNGQQMSLKEECTRILDELQKAQ
jgi:hypothetical protein